MFRGLYQLLKVLFPRGPSSPAQRPLPHPGHQGCPPVAPPASTSPCSSILHSSGPSHRSLAQNLCGSAQCLGAALITQLRGAPPALPPIAPSSPVRTGPPPVPQGSWCCPISSGTALPPHPHPGSLTVLPGRHKCCRLLGAFSDRLPGGSELSLSPLSSHRFRIKGLEGILCFPLFTPRRALLGGED